MAKFRRGGRGGGGDRSGQLRAKIDQTTATINTQQQAWSELMASLAEYRAAEIPDTSAAIVAATDSLALQSSAWQKLGGVVSEVASGAIVEFAKSSKAALDSVDAEIDDQASLWAKLSVAIARAGATGVASYATEVASETTSADSSVEAHSKAWSQLGSLVSGVAHGVGEVVGRELAYSFSGAGTAAAQFGTTATQSMAKVAPSVATATAASNAFATTSASGFNAASSAMDAGTRAATRLGTTVATGLSAAASVSRSVVPALASVATSSATMATSFARSIGGMGPTLAVAANSAVSYGRQVSPVLIESGKQFAGHAALANLSLASIGPMLSSAATATIAYAQSLGPALTSAGGAFANLTATIGRQVVLTAPSLLTLGGAMMGVAATVLQTIGRIIPSAVSMGSAIASGVGMATRALLAFSPHWRLISVAAAAATLVYKASTSEMAVEAYNAAKQNANLSESIDRLKEAAGGFASASTSMFTGAATSGESFLQSFNPFPWLFGEMTRQASRFANVATGVLLAATPKMQAFSDVTTNTAYSLLNLGSATDASAEKFYEETKALREMANELERLNKLQQQQRPMFAQLGSMQQSAADAAEHNAEMQRIGSLASAEAIDRETQALQEKIAAAILDGSITETQLRQAEQLFGVLAGRKQGVEAGTIKPQADKMLDDGTRRIAGLASGDATFFKNEAEIDRLRELSKAQGDSAERTETLVAAKREQQRVEAVLTSQIKMAEAAQRAQNQALDEAAATQRQAQATLTDIRDKIDVMTGAATEAEIAMRKLARQNVPPELAGDIATATAELERLGKAKTGDEKITTLRDQIDLLSGAATEADIAMRELTRQGFSDEQIAEIGALTGELDRLKDAQNKTPKGRDEKTLSDAAMAGTKEAAQISLRHVGGDRMQSVAEQQLAVQREIAKGVNQKPVAPVGVPQMPEAAVPGLPAGVVPMRNAPLLLKPNMGVNMFGDIAPGIDAAQNAPPLGPPALPPPPAAPAAVAVAAPALPPSRAGLAEQPKITGVSDRATEGRRESKEDQIVAVLRSILEEEKRNTSAINEIEIPEMQTGIV